MLKALLFINAKNPRVLSMLVKSHDMNVWPENKYLGCTKMSTDSDSGFPRMFILLKRQHGAFQNRGNNYSHLGFLHKI